jgi:hypothetical protein
MPYFGTALIIDTTPQECDASPHCFDDPRSYTMAFVNGINNGTDWLVYGLHTQQGSYERHTSPYSPLITLNVLDSDVRIIGQPTVIKWTPDP